MKIKQNTIDSTIGRLYNSTNKQTNKQTKVQFCIQGGGRNTYALTSTRWEVEDI